MSRSARQHDKLYKVLVSMSYVVVCSMEVHLDSNLEGFGKKVGSNSVPSCQSFLGSSPLWLFFVCKPTVAACLECVSRNKQTDW